MSLGYLWLNQNLKDLKDLSAGGVDQDSLGNGSALPFPGLPRWLVLVFALGWLVLVGETFLPTATFRGGYGLLSRLIQTLTNGSKKEEMVPRTSMGHSTNGLSWN